jgi:hypothetical protein
MSKQELGLNPPGDDETMLRLAIQCLDCGALRVFNYVQALAGLAGRKVAHTRIETTCEHCNRKLAVTFFWAAPEPAGGFSFVMPELGDKIGSEDGMGLRRQPMRWP